MKIFVVLSFLVVAVSCGVKHPLQLQLPIVSDGLLALNDEDRITNGQRAEVGQFPYQVGLSLDFGDHRSWCGGTLLSDRWVLTAAHCTDGVDGVTVYLGALDRENPKEEGQQRVFVDKKNVIVHKNWDFDTLTNDISLLKLPAPVKFNKFVQPAMLPKKSDSYSTYVDEMVCASGWGRESDLSMGVARFLNYILTPVISQENCNKAFRGMITDKMVCIGGENGKSTCNGDSGGPLVHQVDNVNYVIGATSFGSALGCEKGWPAVFTRVTAYLDWIEQQSGLVNM